MFLLHLSDEQESVQLSISFCRLCPGLNSVIRSLVMTLWWGYGVRNIKGFKYGYEGLNPTSGKYEMLTPTSVSRIHGFGGSAVGTSRGPQKVDEMVSRRELACAKYHTLSHFSQPGRHACSRKSKHPLHHWRRWHAAGRSRHYCRDTEAQFANLNRWCSEND